jgi:triosephosphate isomerase (TIM)
MARHALIVGNWKMNTTRSEAVALATQLAESESGAGADVVICPPFTWLETVHAVIEGTALRLGAQDCAAEEHGAFTGQVSPSMLAPWCSHVIVGHSERRRDACESDELIGQKAVAALEASLTPIICVGEHLEIRERGDAAAYVSGQVARIMDVVGTERMARCVIAYEPIWAIGTGRAASERDAEEMASSIRTTIADGGVEDAGELPILYGGSVTPEIARELLSQPSINGALVGSASLKAESFKAIVESV